MPNWLSGIVTWAQAHKGSALGLSGLLLVLVVFLLTPGDKEEPVRQQEEGLFEGAALPGDVPTAKALSDMQVVQELLEASIRNLHAENAQIKSALQLQKERVDVQDRTLQQRLDQAIENSLAEAIEILAQRQPAVAVAPTVAPPPRLRILRPGDAPSPIIQTQPQKQPAPTPEPTSPWIHLPAGSLAAGEIVTGAFATKVRSDGLPVLAQLHTAYLGPNGYEIPLDGCLMIGKATADIQTIRARVEAVTLSCVLPDGNSFDRKVRGYFTGADGTLGVPGTWQFRQGAWLGNLLAAMGTAAGGIYGGVKINEALGGAGLVVGDRTLELTERIEDFFLERAEEILPVVWVETQTPVYVVMLEGVTIEGLPEMPHVPWASASLD